MCIRDSSYMALIPIIQPPIMKAFTSEKNRKIEMAQLRTVSRREKIIFPIAITIFAVSYTHLDVYKRQGHAGNAGHRGL